MVRKVVTIPAGQFKANCSRLLDAIDREGLEVIVTKRGVPVARFEAANLTAASAHRSRRHRVFPVAEFRATCLALFDEVGPGDPSIVVTKHGRPVATVTGPDAQEEPEDNIDRTTPWPKNWPFPDLRHMYTYMGDVESPIDQPGQPRVGVGTKLRRPSLAHLVEFSGDVESPIDADWDAMN